MSTFVIDANCDCREILALTLELEGHEVVVFDNFADAILALPRWMPALVITDMAVPGVHTVSEFTSELRSLCPDATLIIHSAVPTWMERVSELGADAFVPKPDSIFDSVPALLRAAELHHHR
jgi:DNA-binding NtrC family response regulator